MSIATGRLATGTARGKTGVYSGQSIGQGVAPSSLKQIPEGKITATIYSFIRDSRFNEVIKILLNENSCSRTRPTLSLLGYCYYQVQEYYNAADW
jgi:tetratricopeptide repeat protein 30